MVLTALPALLVLTAAALAGLRVGGHSGLFFQAVAHVFVGGLIGGWLGTRRPLLLWLAAGLSVIEVACAVYFRLLR